MPSVSSRLVVGQRLEVRTDAEWRPTRLEDINSKDEVLTVAWPTDRERRLMPLKAGDTLELSASAQDALYSATVRVISTTTDSVRLVHVAVVGEWGRLQRREAVRLPIAVLPRLAFRLRDETEEALTVGITNISANGLQLRCQQEVKLGDLLELTFSLMDVPDDLSVSARVKRVMQQERIWVAGCQLENVSDKTARQIVQFIFAQQRAEIARLRKVS